MTQTEIASWQADAGRRLLEQVGVRAGSTVLDFGCREGNYAAVAARIAAPSGKVYAVDKNREPLDGFIRSADEEGLNNVVALHTSGEVQLPLPDACVDVVLLYDVVHLIGWSGETKRRSTAADRRALMKELLRIVRPGGVVSAYCTHLSTHTDVTSERDIARELSAEGFRFRDDWEADMVHDSKPVRGHVMNFVRPPEAKRAPQ